MAYNIADLFEHTVDLVADREVLVVGDERRTYGQLEERANRLAHHLIDQGIGPGDHIGIYGPNSVEWIEGALAAYKIRAVPVNVNYRYVDDELRYLFDNADLKALVYDRDLGPRIESVRRALPLLQHLVHIEDGSEAAGARREHRHRRRRSPRGRPSATSRHGRADDHYIIYTGGTTGMPKGVIWRHEDVFFALGGGIDAYTNERVADEWTLAKRAAEAAGWDDLAQPAAAHARGRPVGPLALRVRGQPGGVPRPPVRCRRGVAHHRPRGRQHRVDHRGCDGPPDDRRARRDGGLRRTGRPRPVVDVRAGVDRGDLLAHGEGPVPRALPGPDAHRRHRLVGDRLERHADGGQGRHAEHRGRADRAGRP